jgi:hypothetical protein
MITKYSTVQFLTTVTARVGRSASKGDDTSGKVWSVYLSEAERQDRALAENWKGDTEGILIFVRVLSDLPLLKALTLSTQDWSLCCYRGGVHH